MGFDIRFLLKLFLRRLHYFLLVALPVAGLGLWLSYSLPASYSAQARLLVESPQVPSDLAASTMRAETEEVLQVIAQRILTRANLLELSREFRLHADRPEMGADAIVADMRRRITIALPRRQDAAAFINVSFDAPDPRVSADVTNSLVTQILRDNVALRTATTAQTLEFFDQEVARLDDELSRQSARIVTFQEANRDALPDSLAFRRARQTSQQERLLQLERETASLRDRRERLVEMFERTGRIETAAEAQTPEQRQLRQLQNELASALVVFAPENPRVRNLRNQITALEEIVASQSASAAVGEGGMAMNLLDVQLADIDAQLDFIAAQRRAIEVELDELRATIEATPSNAVTLAALERDMANLQAQYDQAIARRAQARTGERIEAQARGQRITVIEQAIAPEEPAKPNRRAIAIAGVGGGVVMGLAFVALLELFKTAVRRPSEITARMGVPPFATIPFLRTRRQVMARRVTIGLVLLLAAGAIPAGLWLVDQHVMPLDLALDRAMQRSGLNELIVLLRPPGS